jgi:transposase
MEIITGVERRRRWRLDEKLRIVAEVDGGALLAEVARRHEVSRGLLWNWCRQVRQGSLAAEPTPMFTPVQITADTPVHGQRRLSATVPGVPGATQAAALAASGQIEIVLPDGICIRVGGDVGLAALRRVVTALRR